MAVITSASALELALQFHRTGEYSAAENLYRKVLAIEPTHPVALHGLGLIEIRAGRNDEGVKLLRRAIALRPGEVDWHFELANTLLMLGRTEEAIAAYTCLLKLNPDLAPVHDNLGTALQTFGDLDGAIAAHRQAVALNPDFASALNNLGTALRCRTMLGDPAGNSSVARTGPRIRAQYAEAIEAHRRATALDPNSASFHNNLGNTLAIAGQLDEAVAAFQKALALDPSYTSAQANLSRPLLEQGRIDEVLETMRKALAATPDDAALHSALIRTTLCHPDFGWREVQRECERWDQKHGAGRHVPISRHPNEPNSARRLKIGYVSSDFWDNVVGRNLMPLFREHDHAQVEVFSYCGNRETDALTEAFRSLSDHWRESSGLSDEDLCARIGEDRIDVLVDLSLHTSGNRLTALARKPAPVQCSFAAYPGTTGMAAMDYRVTDRFLEPEGDSRLPGQEQPLHIPSFWCYDPMAAVAVGESPALANGYVTFGCLHQFAKINTGMIHLWKRILEATGNSHLLICTAEGSHRERFLRELGVANERVQMLEEAPRIDYLARYRSVDIVLDTFPYNGHTTNLDALWMGVPVVTLAGDSPVSRAGLSQLSNLGLAELVAHSADEYVEKAIRLSRDVSRLSALRKSLRPMMEASVLMDAPRFARELERAFREMWRRWCTRTMA